MSGFAGAAQANDNYCREYTRAIVIDGQKQEGYGTACLQPDGSWEIVSEDKLADAKSYSAVKHVAVKDRAYQPIVIYSNNKSYKKRSQKYARSHYSRGNNNYRHRNTSTVWWR